MLSSVQFKSLSVVNNMKILVVLMLLTCQYSMAFPPLSTDEFEEQLAKEVSSFQTLDTRFELYLLHRLSRGMKMETFS